MDICVKKSCMDTRYKPSLWRHQRYEKLRRSLQTSTWGQHCVLSRRLTQWERVQSYRQFHKQRPTESTVQGNCKGSDVT